MKKRTIPMIHTPFLFTPLRFRWQIAIIIISLSAIILYWLFHLFSFSFADAPLWIAIVCGGIPSFFQILHKLFKKNPGADTLAAIAFITALLQNQYLAAVFLVLMLAGGQALETYAMRKASSVLLALAERMPACVHRKVENEIQDISLLDVRIGDIIVVYPHETCPVDGVVIEGQGAMDESYLTGEPYQVSKGPGTAVLSGAINGETVLILHTQKLPADSRYASIVTVLQEAEQKRPALRRLGDQIGAVFAPFALIIAIAAWYFSQDALRFLAVLVIATPCPLLIAIPITIITAISIAAKQGIIIKDPAVLERLPTCRTAIFDKTGTLTYGKPALTKIYTCNNIDKNQVLQYAASLERYSKHPLSGAIIQAAKNRQLPFLDATQISEKPGQGLSGRFGENNIHLTHRKKILEFHPDLIDQLPPLSSGLECVVLVNNTYTATMHFRDIPRKESPSFIHHLTPRHQFNKLMLVSGDRESEVKYLGKLLHFSEIHASQSPEQKLSLIRSESKKAGTLFMGDGINDAPAIAAATVGIAFGQYSNITSEAADAVIMDNTLEKVDVLLHLSINTRKIALQSAVGGMALSLIGMGFAAAGWISPVAGAVLQEVIDIAAIVNALQLLWRNRTQVDFLAEQP